MFDYVKTRSIRIREAENMARTILHSDLNCFYASVEMAMDSTLRGKAMAVCGSIENRHGIILAKSEPAKRAGVKTAMVAWEAKQLCPELILVPPHFDKYAEYSRRVRQIYARYTDMIEPFGMDECWLDVTGSRIIAGSGVDIAEKIRREVREELDLTVSIGVSFNKVFAKLGSDLKKPDAVSVITEENFRRVVWPLPLGDLLYAGPATVNRLATFGINTIGDAARTPKHQLIHLLGKQGETLWTFANGLDSARVMPAGHEAPPKSVGHGVTCSSDLHDAQEVWRVELDLAQEIGHRLRKQNLSAQGVQLAIRDNVLATRQYQAQLLYPTQSPLELARAAHELFARQYNWALPVRAVTVTAINLIPEAQPVQMSLFDDMHLHLRQARIDAAVEKIRGRFGNAAIRPAVLMGEHKMGSDELKEMKMPGQMYT